MFWTQGQEMAMAMALELGAKVDYNTAKSVSAASSSSQGFR